MAIKILGHRGMGPTSRFADTPEKHLVKHLPPENSLLAFQTCLEESGDGIEVDICPSKDHVAMIIHNNALNKNIYRAQRDKLDLGFVSDFTAHQLQHKNKNGKLDYPLGPHQEKILTLTELLNWMVEENKKRLQDQLAPIHLDIELKRSGAAKAAWQAVQPFIEARKLHAEDITFCSFKFEQLKGIYELDKRHATYSRKAITIRTSLLYGLDNIREKGVPVAPFISYEARGIETLTNKVKRFNLCALDAEYNDIEQELIDLTINHKLELHCWPSDLGPREPNPVFLQNIFKWEDKISTIIIKTDTPRKVRDYLCYYHTEIAPLDLSKITVTSTICIDQGPGQALKKLSQNPFLSSGYAFVQLKAKSNENSSFYAYVVMETTQFKQIQSDKMQNLPTHFRPFMKHLIFIKRRAPTSTETQQVYDYFAKHYTGKHLVRSKSDLTNC